MNSSLDINTRSEKSDHVFKASVAPLSEGFVKIYEPTLVKVQSALRDLNEKKLVLFQQVHEENLKLAETQYSPELIDIFNKVEAYKNKLCTIKKDMKSLHDKSKKLKKRALKLQQVKEKEIYLKQQKETEIQMEQDLIPKTSGN